MIFSYFKNIIMTKNIRLINPERVSASIKRGGLALATFFCLTLFGCSDDLDVKTGIYDYPSSGFAIRFEIPEAQHILTRSNDSENERKITSLSLLVFDKNSNLLKRIDLNDSEISRARNGFESENRSFIYQIAIEEIQITNENIGDIYAVANAKMSDGKDLLKDFTNNTSTEEDLIEIYSNFSRSENGFLMAGKMNDHRVVLLNRTAARISLTDEFNDASFTLHNFAVYNVAEECFLAAEVRKSLNDANKPWYRNEINSYEQETTKVGKVGVNEDNSFEFTYDCYVNPTKTHEDLKVYTYVVLFANYQGQDYYYAVPLYRNDRKEGEEYYYDIEPNHWYDMRIKNVLKEGWGNPLTAIENHNDNQIWVEIHDHTPEILSMVSDGIHELGVTRELNFDKTNNEKELTVKCFAADMDNIDPEKEINFTKEDWVTITKVAATDYIKESGDTDKDNPGIIITYKVTVDTERAVYTEESSIITVKWKGLERNVTINYDPGFQISDICEASLTIKPDGSDSNSKEIKSYWTFIKGSGTAKTDKSTGTTPSETPKLYGTEAQNLVNGKVRTNGFHFPMPYGENIKTTPWKYEYTLDFSTQNQNDVSANIEKIEVTLSDNMKSKVQWTPSGVVKGKLSWIGESTSYLYETGTIRFTISYRDSSPATILNLGIYHTGFFHFDENEEYCPQEEFGYYYYEVVPLKGGYWLDRNIGAQSNMMFVDNGTEEGAGNPLAKGRYYKVADYHMFSDPTITAQMCPPGYSIPDAAEWNVVRLSAEFTSEDDQYLNVDYLSTYYNSTVGKIYFPRAKYWNSTDAQKYQTSSNMGDSSTGYYWTMTPAPGMEKYEMGKWLRALYLNGENSTYLNTNVEESRMNVRCVAKVSALDQESNYVSFNVHNATHVYLFDRSTKSPVYTFPGKPIGTSDSATRWQYFSCTTSYPLENLLMIFLKVDNGKVTIFTRDGDNFKDNEEFGEGILNKDHAWELERGKYYDFCQSAYDRVTGSVSEEQPDECDAVLHPGGNGQGGEGGGNGEVTPGRNETQRGEERTPGNNEIKIWTGNQSLYWGRTSITNVNWKLVPVGSKIRIYGDANDTSANFWCVGIRRDNDSITPFFGINDADFQYNGVNGFVEIELTEDLLNEIRQYGICMVGASFTVHDVTLILNGDWLTPTLKSGDYYWEGQISAPWNPFFDDLKSDSYDWTKVPAGSTLTVDYKEIGQSQVRICYGNGEVLAGYDPWRNYGNLLIHPIELTLTQDILNNIIAKGGIYFNGGDYILTKVDLKMAQ